jgi:hypothetical protein
MSDLSRDPGQSSRRHFGWFATNAAQRRHLARLGVTMTLYIASLFFVVWLFKHQPPEGAIKYVLAVLPALPEIGIIVAMALYLVEEKDEFLRMRQTLALLSGLGGTLALTSAWGFLEVFAHLPHLDSFAIFPCFCVLWGIAQGVLAWVYR